MASRKLFIPPSDSEAKKLLTLLLLQDETSKTAGDTPIDIGDHKMKATVKSFYNPFLKLFCGVQKTIILQDEKGKPALELTYYKPSILSRIFFGNQERIHIKPLGVNPANLALAESCLEIINPDESCQVTRTADFETRLQEYSKATETRRPSP